MVQGTTPSATSILYLKLYRYTSTGTLPTLPLRIQCKGGVLEKGEEGGNPAVEKSEEHPSDEYPYF
eukprot:316000-Hanusia_phi.AAC.3